MPVLNLQANAFVRNVALSNVYCLAEEAQAAEPEQYFLSRSTTQEGEKVGESGGAEGVDTSPHKNFGRPVLGCIEADNCKKMLMLLHFLQI